MSANPTNTPAFETAQRDRLLRRLVACFALAALVALALAITTSIWQQTLGDFQPVSLAQEVPQ